MKIEGKQKSLSAYCVLCLQIKCAVKFNRTCEIFNIDRFLWRSNQCKYTVWTYGPNESVCIGNKSPNMSMHPMSVSRLIESTFEFLLRIKWRVGRLTWLLFFQFQFTWILSALYGYERFFAVRNRYRVCCVSSHRNQATKINRPTIIFFFDRCCVIHIFFPLL